jgi:hypothetical protein
MVALMVAHESSARDRNERAEALRTELGPARGVGALAVTIFSGFGAVLQ